MTQEDKELLFKDLCARMPYGVKCAIFDKELGFGGIPGFEGKYPFVIDGITQEGDDIDVWVERGNFSLETVKPYLFPLSRLNSLTDEQKKTLKVLCDWNDEEADAQSILVLYQKHFVMKSDVIDWLHKNHFDYRGLIEMGLALDATDKNIY